MQSYRKRTNSSLFHDTPLYLFLLIEKGRVTIRTVCCICMHANAKDAPSEHSDILEAL